MHMESWIEEWELCILETGCQVANALPGTGAIEHCPSLLMSLVFYT